MKNLNKLSEPKMISFSEVKNLAAKYGVPRETIEKDYCLTWVLLGMAKLKIASELIFYGGTALKKIYFDDYRFSYDLDFILLHLEVNELLENFAKVFTYLKKKANLKCELNPERVWREGGRSKFPLAYDGFAQIGGIKEVEVDVVKLTETEITKPIKERKILTQYSDLKDASAKLRVYSLEAIATDKLVTVLDTSRSEPRDLYDLWYLLKRGRLNLKVICDNFEKKCGYKIPIQTIKEEIRTPFYRKRWEKRLKDQIHNLPSIDEVIAEMNTLLEKFA